MKTLPIYFILLFFSQLNFASGYSAAAIGMGSTGVASHSPYNMNTLNPAILSHPKAQPRFHFILPSLIGNIKAHQDIIDQYEQIEGENFLLTISNALSQMQQNTSMLQNLTEETRKILLTFNQSLLQIDQKPVDLSIGIATQLALIKKKWSIGFYSNLLFEAEGFADIDPCDNELLNNYMLLMRYIQTVGLQGEFNATFACKANKTPIPLLVAVAGKPFTLLSPLARDPSTNRYLFDSSIPVVMMLLAEQGITVSKRFDYPSFWLSMSITPKFQQFTTLFTNPDINSIDSNRFNISDQWQNNRTKQSFFNTDLGFALGHHRYPSWSIAMVMKNFFPSSFLTNPFIQEDTDRSQVRLHFKTQWIAGISYRYKNRLRFSFDLDLNRKEGIFNHNDSQFLALGVDVQLFKKLQLRAGSRINLLSNTAIMYSLGLGMNLWGLHFDLGGQLGNNTAAIAAQMGLSF